MKIETENLKKLMVALAQEGGSAPGKAHVRDAALYALDTLDLATEIGNSLFTGVSIDVIFQIYDRVDRERQRLEGASPAPGMVMILPAKEIEGETGG